MRQSKQPHHHAIITDAAKRCDASWYLLHVRNAG